jgi:hypothetical protein
VIPTLRRSRDDVFLIGEEQILTDPAAADPGPLFTTGPEDGHSSRLPSRPPRTPGSLHGARGIALLGLGAGAAALLAALELGGGGEGPAHPPATSPARSPLISRSVARVPAGPKARVHTPAARPAEVNRPTVAHHQRPRHSEAPVRSRPPTTAGEPEREPTLPVAPVSSTAVVGAEPTPAPEEAPPATAEPTPPGPPPSSSGGGPEGVESFGFER